MKTAYDFQTRLYELDISLAESYAKSTPDTITELLLRLATNMKSLMKENKQLLEILGDKE